ncbi:S-adenosyl-L-methionine-dependent methyltransferase [Fusarium redolens]|uniref:S-adenosyl-L-methionine-dependent methyltransferase n=1 Tax=Fusarium redolens TaxID=48865 RepID=A0A9P9KJ43_FUSRE|nr:S-adenosyl-L-methionine-dependent methyltransferase [Fusarium redolens]KAH7258986.1 S-adenosyl-L-methionine-dependent methyltransferase [Fusarium redolens]
MELPADMKNRLRASYNAIAPAYNTWTARHNELRLTYLDKLLNSCPQLASTGDTTTKQVLELGCGSGSPFISTLLARSPSVHVYANDLSDVQLDLARHNLANYKDRVEFHPGDMMKLDFAPGSLTAVVALYSIIHLPQEEQKEMMRRIGHWLAPGGVFLSTFGTEEAPSIVDEKWIEEKGWMFWSGLGKEAVLKALTHDAGLDVQHAVLEEVEDDSFLWIISKKVKASHCIEETKPV